MTSVDPGKSRAEFDEEPFRAIGGPNGHVLAGGKAKQKRTCDFFGFLEQLRESPATSGAVVQGSLDR